MRTYFTQVYKTTAIIIFVCVCLITITYFIKDRPRPLPPRQISASSGLTLHEKWRIQTGFITTGWSSIVTTPLGLLFPNNDNQLMFRNRQIGQLTLINYQTGQIIWQTQYEGRVDSLVTDEAIVYLASGFRITAYQLSNGQQVWQTAQQKDRTGYYLFLKKNKLYEFDSSGGYIHIFDPKTGMKLGQFSSPSFYGDLGDYYLNGDSDRIWLRAWDKSSNLWHIDKSWITRPSVINSDILVMTVGQIDLDLLVVKLHTGEILWQKPHMVSNPVILGDKIYVINNKAIIQAYDLRGNLVGEVYTQPSQADNSRFDFTLVTDNIDSIYVYYGDSQEIIALTQ